MVLKCVTQLFITSQSSRAMTLCLRLQLFDNIKWAAAQQNQQKDLCALPTLQISLDICAVWSVFLVHMKKLWVHSFPLSAQARLWPDCADEFTVCTCHFVSYVVLMHKLAAAWQNLQNDLCAQQRLRSAWVSARSDQSLHLRSMGS